MKTFPTEAARHTHQAGVYRWAADAFRAGSPAQAKFAPVLDAWAERADARAAAPDLSQQPDLFAGAS